MDIEHFRSHRQMSDRPHKRDCRLPIIAGTFFLHYSTEASRSTGGSGGSEPPVLREALVLRNSKRKSALYAKAATDLQYARAAMRPGATLLRLAVSKPLCKKERSDSGAIGDA